MKLCKRVGSVSAINWQWSTHWQNFSCTPSMLYNWRSLVSGSMGISILSQLWNVLNLVLYPNSRFLQDLLTSFKPAVIVKVPFWNQFWSCYHNEYTQHSFLCDVVGNWPADHIVGKKTAKSSMSINLYSACTALLHENNTNTNDK